MSETQLILPFAAPVTPPRDLYFFALRPDGPARGAIAELARLCRAASGLPERSIAVERLHASLLAVEGRQGFRRGEVARAAVAATRVVAPAFALHFDRICSFRSRGLRPVVLCGDTGTEEVTALRERLRAELALEGLSPGPRLFTPHLTLFRDRQPVPDLPVDPPVGWRVGEFLLLRSLVGRGRHHVIGRWPLLEPPAARGGGASGFARGRRGGHTCLSGGTAGPHGEHGEAGR